MNGDREHRIRQRAHAIWEREGRQHGSDERHWSLAVAEIEAEDKVVSTPVSITVPPIAATTAPASAEAIAVGEVTAKDTKKAPVRVRKPAARATPAATTPPDVSAAASKPARKPAAPKKTKV